VAKELLAEMLRSRREAAELAAAHGSSPAGGDAASALTAGGEVADGPTAAAAAAAAGGELPDDVIVQLLKREALLTRAKLHALQWERGRMERELRSLRTQIKAVSAPHVGSRARGLCWGGGRGCLQSAPGCCRQELDTIAPCDMQIDMCSRMTTAGRARAGAAQAGA
jgi:hypothetical protein